LIFYKEFHFDLDVCASKENHKCEKYFSKKDDGLKQDWNGVCWMNPPYGREIKDWMQKTKNESKNGVTIVCLVPARPDTEWWWENCIQGEIRFIRGRLRWSRSNTVAPFPSAIIIIGPKIKSKVVWWDVQPKE
jgi:phage N-6-adenine-methyltransferase